MHQQFGFPRRLWGLTALIASAVLFVLLAVPNGAQAAAPGYAWDQGFESSTVGWFTDGGRGTIVRVASSTNGIPSAAGDFYAQVSGNSTNHGGPFSRFDGYRSTWPGSWTAEIDVYLDPTWTNGAGFDYSVATNDTSGTHKRDFVFHVTKDSDGQTILVGASNNSNNAPRLDLRSINHAEVTQAGWYTLQHHFYEEGGVLKVDLRLLDASDNQLFIETRSDASDTIPGVIGGNRYGWFTHITNISALAVDNQQLEVQNLTVVVTPASTDWIFDDDDYPGGIGELVMGPATPPLGVGSVHFALQNTAREIYGTAAYAGTRLDQITALEYKTYQASSGVVAVSLQFDIDYDPNDTFAGWQGRLVYEPTNSETVLQGQWQTWSPLDGKWWSSKEPGSDHCPQATPCTWADVLRYFPNAKLWDSVGFLWLKAGGPAAGFNGNADALTIGVNHINVTYDFEPRTLYIKDGALNVPDSQDTINVPVWLDSGGLSSVGFSLDYDSGCLSVTDSDAATDLNHVPDFASLAVIPNGFVLSAQVDPADGDSELDIAIYDPMPVAGVFDALPQGVLLTIPFVINPSCRNDHAEVIQFSTAPAPSFADTSSHPASGSWQGGTITLDFNQPATGISLTPHRVYEDMPTTEAVGALSVNDPDTWETFTFVLPAGVGDNDLFTLAGSQIMAKGPYNHDVAVSHTIHVQATGDGGTVVESDIVVTVADYSVLALPQAAEYKSGVVGSALAVPVTIDRNSNFVTKVNFTVAYEAACLSFTGLNGYPSDWTATADTSVADHVAVAMVGGAPLSGSALVTLNFTVAAACAAPYPETPSFTAKALEDADGPVSARATDGVLYIIENDARGDCNSDGAVNAADFGSVVLEVFDEDTDYVPGRAGFWLEAPRLSFIGSPQGCDANSDTAIAMPDVTCTVNVFFGRLGCTTGSASIASMTAAAVVAQQKAVVTDGALEIPVTLTSNGSAVAAAGLTMTYDPARYTLDPTDANQDGIPDAITFHVPASVMRWAFVNTAEGKLQLAAAGLQLPLPTFSDGALVTVRLQPCDGADGSDITIGGVSLGNTDGFNVPVKVTGPDGTPGTDPTGGLPGKTFLPLLNR